ncbi:MAG TPA: hypothetical protein VFF33_08645 [Ignavibacteriaceae bacterium]|nr:hypothetical protein [Ignavibacteriaceae bacterium]
MKLRILTLSFILLAFIAGCSEKFDITQFKTDENNANVGGDTVYIQLNPTWEGFNNPQDLLIGKEPFLYVADTDNDRIVMMNLDGKVLGYRSIKKPIAITQDYKLNLIVCAEFDTLINGVTKTYSAVYKLNMVAANHNIDAAPIKMILPRPSDLSAPERKYTGVTAFYDNSFYVSRFGPNNTSFIDPDNSILVFNVIDNKDSLVGKVSLLEPLGTGLSSANNITSLTSFSRKNIDIIATYKGNNSFKVQWLTFISTNEKSAYESKLSPVNAEMMIPNRFSQPEGTCIDNSGNIFVADAGKDSIFKFNARGEQLQSIAGDDALKLKSPYAVGFFDKTIYVADTKNNRIVRFILSTDIR